MAIRGQSQLDGGKKSGRKGRPARPLLANSNERGGVVVTDEAIFLRKKQLVYTRRVTCMGGKLP